MAETSLVPCSECGEPTEEGPMNCSWECYVSSEVKRGAIVIAPNGLPTCCYTGYPGAEPGVFLECEDARHPDYKMPVKAVWMSEWNKIPQRYDQEYHLHAVIYFDGCVIVTLYECCFYMWLDATGHAVNYRLLPDYMDQKHQIISEESRAELRRRYPPKER